MDQQGERVLELLEEKWFSNTAASPAAGDGSSSRPHHDQGGRKRGSRRRVYAVDTPEQHAMRPSIFSSRERDPSSSAAEDSSGHSKVLPLSPSLSGDVEYEMDASSLASGAEEEESPVDRYPHHDVETRRMISITGIVSHVCAAIYLVVFVAEVCVDMAVCLRDFVRKHN